MHQTLLLLFILFAFELMFSKASDRYPSKPTVLVDILKASRWHLRCGKGFNGERKHIFSWNAAHQWRLWAHSLSAWFDVEKAPDAFTLSQSPSHFLHPSTFLLCFKTGYAPNVFILYVFTPFLCLSEFPTNYMVFRLLFCRPSLHFPYKRVVFISDIFIAYSKYCSRTEVPASTESVLICCRTNATHITAHWPWFFGHFDLTGQGTASVLSPGLTQLLGFIVVQQITEQRTTSSRGYVSTCFFAMENESCIMFQQLRNRHCWHWYLKKSNVCDA